jgi:hypothetical protein
MHRFTLKTSTIFIAKGRKTRVYRSVHEVPRRLRQELEESTNGFNSATILIADRRGREEIVRALHGLPSALRSRLAPSLKPKPDTVAAPVASAARPLVRFLRQNWLQIALPGAVGLAVWAALSWR